jgi:hypothetical protein
VFGIALLFLPMGRLREALDRLEPHVPPRRDFGLACRPASSISPTSP